MHMQSPWLLLQLKLQSIRRSDRGHHAGARRRVHHTPGSGVSAGRSIRYCGKYRSRPSPHRSITICAPVMCRDSSDARNAEGRPRAHRSNRFRDGSRGAGSECPSPAHREPSRHTRGRSALAIRLSCYRCRRSPKRRSRRCLAASAAPARAAQAPAPIGVNWCSVAPGKQMAPRPSKRPLRRRESPRKNRRGADGS